MTERELPPYDEKQRRLIAYSDGHVQGIDYEIKSLVGSDDEELNRLFDGCIQQHTTWEGDTPREVEYIIWHPHYRVARAVIRAELLQPAPSQRTRRARELGLYEVWREITDDGCTPVKAIIELARYSTIFSRALTGGAPAGRRQTTEERYTDLAQGWAEAKAKTPPLTQAEYAHKRRVSVRTLQRAIAAKATEKGDNL